MEGPHRFRDVTTGSPVPVVIVGDEAGGFRWKTGTLLGPSRSHPDTEAAVKLDQYPTLRFRVPYGWLRERSLVEGLL